MRRKALSSLLALLLLAVASYGNGLNLNGVGAKAIAMGGAFVGLADDYSAAFWNPAGLTYLDSTAVALYATDIIPSASYKLDLLGIDARSKKEGVMAGMLAFYNRIDEDLITGIAIYVPSGLQIKWDPTQLTPLTAGKQFTWESRIYTIAFSPVIAYRYSDWLSLGAAMNIYYGKMDMKMGTILMGSIPSQYSSSGSGYAVGATLGIMIEPIDLLQIGLTVRTPYKLSLSGETEIEALGQLGYSPSSGWDSSITFPWWIAGGIAFFPTEDLTLTFDLQWTGWSSLKEITYDYDDPVWHVMFEATGANKFELDWASKLQIRFGAEYYLTDEIAVRAGYYHDPAPAPEKTLNILLPSITYNAFTFGAGYVGESFSVELAGEVLLGIRRTAPLGSLMPGDHSMNVYTFSVAVCYYF